MTRVEAKIFLFPYMYGQFGNQLKDYTIEWVEVPK